MGKAEVFAVLLIAIGIGFVYYSFFLPKADVNFAYPQKIPVEKEETENLHFSHLPVTYSLATNTNANARTCPDFQIERIRLAFEIIQNSTNSTLRFEEVESDNGDILIYCSNAAGDGVYMTSGTGGYESKGNIITKGTLTMYTHRNCGTWPDVEIHEILHIFGFGHVDDEWSILNPVQKRCDLGKIDDWIIEDLVETYLKV